MQAHEKAALPAATGKTADAETLTEMSLAHDSQKSNKNFSGSGGNAAAPALGHVAINGEQLMQMDLPPLNYVIDGLLTEGLYLLAGGPKMGKSWMMLQFCLSITQGESVWGFQTNGKSVLYMCLEDSYRRVRRRIDQLDEVATKNLHFLNSAPLLGNGLEELIEGHVQLFPNTSLVIIDTLQMVRGTEVGTYFRDYADMQVFKKLADKLGTTILLVHHTRKSGDDNPFNTISGSTGLTGAVDGSFVLVRDEKRPRYYKLAVTGRDIEQRELTLVFDTTYCLWETVSCDAEIVLDVKEPPEIFFAVCDYIKSIGSFEGSASELLAALDDDITPANMLTKTLNKHREQLAENKILYEYHRTNSKKFIELAYCA